MQRSSWSRLRWSMGPKVFTVMARSFLVWREATPGGVEPPCRGLQPRALQLGQGVEVVLGGVEVAHDARDDRRQRLGGRVRIAEVRLPPVARRLRAMRDLRPRGVHLVAGAGACPR